MPTTPGVRDGAAAPAALSLAVHDGGGVLDDGAARGGGHSAGGADRIPEEPGAPEGEDPTVAGSEPVAGAAGLHNDPRDRLGQAVARHRPEEGCSAEGEDAAVSGGEFQSCGAGTGSADDRGVELFAGQRVAGRCRGVAEGENATVGADQPVAVAVGGANDAHDRLVQRLTRHRPEEGCSAEGEDAAVSGGEFQSCGAGTGSADDRGIELFAGQRVAGRCRGVAEGENATVGADQPVAVAVGGANDAHDRLVQRLTRHRPKELRIAIAEHATVGAD